MNAGTYKLNEFLTYHNLDQIIIPEIQRDYVWQKDNVERFLKSIFDNSKRQKDLSQGITEEILNNLAPEMRETMLRAQKEKQNYCNIGFIYAYSDPEIPDRYVLIDGQQRMTTLFLILLALSVKEKRQDNFKRNYFKDNILKLDYKVREDAHDFLLKFVHYILDGNNILDISNKYWNFTEYQNDITIRSIIDNYLLINDFINENSLSLDYIENFIEFWYFDTNKSKQGEELYLYMNSRGETVSPNESIKANLLKGKSNQEKHEWGTKWEQWQNLFWKYRQRNSNADRGIEEFLRWTKYIEITKSNNEQTNSELAEEIRNIKDTKKISLEGLTLQKIESYFKALEKIINLKDELNFNLNWLTGNNIDTKEYIKLIPILMYAEKYQDSDVIKIKRFARFFLNITRFETISKNPYSSTVDVIRLSTLFFENGFTDITDIINFSDKYKSILSEEEVAKLSIYKQSPDDLRQEIENVFWQAEDYKFCDGKIWLIWDCINFDKTNLSSFNIQKLSDFKGCFDNFKTLFDNPTDLVRRALLTKGDYSVCDGYSTSLERKRYSFINEEKCWKEQLSSNEKIKLYKLLIDDFGTKKKVNNTLKKDDILNQIITDFLNKKSEKDWIYYFVKEPTLLEYCKEKKICGKYENNVEDIALLQATKVVDNYWCYLKDMDVV
jgi:uncharacterized protein with ParB-like and HNH nuclease domain